MWQFFPKGRPMSYKCCFTILLLPASSHGALICPIPTPPNTPISSGSGSSIPLSIGKPLGALAVCQLLCQSLCTFRQDSTCFWEDCFEAWPDKLNLQSTFPVTPKELEGQVSLLGVLPPHTTPGASGVPGPRVWQEVVHLLPLKEQ